MAEPTILVAGDSWAWTRPGGDYAAADGWVLIYYLAQAAGEPKIITTTADGTDHVAAVTAATSAAYAPGLWKWTARATKGATVTTVEMGDLEIRPDPTAAVDRRTLAERCRDAIQTALDSSAGDLVIEYEIDGIKAKKDRAGAIRELAMWTSRARLEKAGAVIRPIPVRFTHV